jgi:hypothetical protein
MKVGTQVRVDGASFGSGVVAGVLPKTSDKLDERFAVPFPQTERRELYAIIAPDSRRDVAAQVETVGLHDQSAPCFVGQWVTVTKDHGIIPSMSVAWRRMEAFMTSWSNNIDTSTSNVEERKAGFALLAAAFRSLAREAVHSPELKDGGRNDDVVSR